MEPAVVNLESAIFRGAEDIRVALPEPNIRVVVGLSCVDRLRGNDVMSRHHHDKRNVRCLEAVGVQSVERALLVENMVERPAQRQRRVLVSQQCEVRVGFIALFGVAVMNGVIMVANLNRVREQGVPLSEAVLIGASERLRPVLITASVATVGMLPAAWATGVGSDVQRSLATVVAGGLIPATLLTLFIIPTLYFVLEGRVARRAPKAAAAVGEN
jgi:hypothetical protein